jgi:hypothetical protein
MGKNGILFATQQILLLLPRLFPTPECGVDDPLCAGSSLALAENVHWGKTAQLHDASDSVQPIDRLMGNA